MATSYYGRSSSADEPDAFEEFDPTPYGGGYDLFVNFGRPLPPSDETCYPCSAPSTSYDAPHYAAEEPSPYGAHQKAQPNYGFRPQDEQQQPSYGGGRHESGYGSKPQPAYGFRPQQEEQEQQQQSYGGGGGEDDESGYGSKPQPAYGFRPQQEEQEQQSYGGGGYGSRPQRAEEDTYGSGYGRKPQQEEEAYGSGYGNQQPEEEGYGRKPQVEESYGSGYGSEHASGYGRKPQTEAGMDMGGRLKTRSKEELMALVVTRSRSRTERRLRVHMVMDRVLPTRSRAMAGKRDTAARSMMTMPTLMMKRRGTTTVATTTMTRHPAWSRYAFVVPTSSHYTE